MGGNLTAWSLHQVLRGMLSLLTAVPIAAFALTPSEVFEHVKDSVVVVRALNAQDKPTSQGSGVMLPSAQVATNCHVLKDGVRFQVGRDKQFVAAELRASDREKDLCLLVALGLAAKPVVLGKAAALKVGEAVYAVGSPQGLELSLSNGIVSQLRGGPPPFIQTTAAISPGSSGGGLFDSEGRLVGITTFFLQGGQSLNFAVPVEWLAEIKLGGERATSERSPAEWLAGWYALWNRKDWRRVLEWSEQWTRAEPHNADAWKHHAISYGHFGRTTEAMAASRQAVRLRPDDADLWISLGVDYWHLDRYTDAVAAHRQAVRLKPKDARTWFWLGRSTFYVKKYSTAIKAFREAVRLKPDDSYAAEVWSLLGKTYICVRRYSDAIDAFREAVRLRPDDSFDWGFLVEAYDLTGDRQAALEAVNEFKRHNPAGDDRALKDKWYRYFGAPEPRQCPGSS